MSQVISCFAQNTPKAVGPYCHATVTEGKTAYISGQLPLNPESMKIESKDVAEQAIQSLENLNHVLSSLGVTNKSVAKTTIFLANIADFAAVNAVYAEYFGEHTPARSCFAVKDLPLGALVEIEAIASL